MALDLTTVAEFVGRINIASAAYPYGSGVDDSTGTAEDGTPYREIWFNDIAGLLQALLVEASIIPSEVADTALVSQYLQAIQAIALAIAQDAITVADLVPSTRVVGTGDGLADGGNLSLNRTHVLDLDDLSTVTSVTKNSEFVPNVNSGGNNEKILWANLITSLGLLASIGDLFNISPMATGDSFAIYDTSVGGNRRITLANFLTQLAGEGLVGSGAALAVKLSEFTVVTSISSAEYAINVNGSGGNERLTWADVIVALGIIARISDIPITAAIASADFLAFGNISASANAKITLANFLTQLASVGLSSSGTSLSISLTELPIVTSLATTDYLARAGTAQGRITVQNWLNQIAGVGLVRNGAGVELSLNELTATTTTLVGTDSIPIIDGALTRKISINGYRMPRSTLASNITLSSIHNNEFLVTTSSINRTVTINASSGQQGATTRFGVQSTGEITFVASGVTLNEDNGLVLEANQIADVTCSTTTQWFVS